MACLTGGPTETTLSVSAQKLSDAALERTKHQVTYNGAYYSIDYPNGDVPEEYGVCTDVVIRAYRKALDVDWQQLIHEDMKKHFSLYPQLWNAKGPDKNIDHRRTQNQECYLKRPGYQLSITNEAEDYRPGDLVYYGDIASGHVGIVVDRYVDGRPMIVHNIGLGPQCEDFLFSSRITGHYRFLPEVE